MKIKVVHAACLAAMLVVSGCKLVKTDDAEKSAEDSDPVPGIVETTFDARLVPALSGKAVEIAALRDGLKGDIETVGKSMGVRVGGDGGGWNFAVRATATVLAENRASKAATADLDIDGDGKKDALLQLGPVVKGTALRDTAGIYDFSSFRDQIVFARLGRALNDHVVGKLPAAGSLAGKKIRLTGAVALRSASDPLLVTPAEVEVLP